MGTSRRDLLRAAGALAAGIPLAELARAPMGLSARAALAAALPTVHPGDVPDVLLLNARVHTMDPAGRLAEAIAVKHGRVIAVGTTQEIAKLAGPGTAKHDLAGLDVMPGFYDSHNHMTSTGIDSFNVDLSKVRTIPEFLAAIKTRVEVTPPGEWVVGSIRWHESQLAEKRYPTRGELDQVAPSHPLWIFRGGHNRLVNSLTLQRAGITKDLPNPPGGTFVRDPGTGELTGHIIGAPAWGRIARLVPPPTREQWLTGLKTAVKAYHAAGITSIIDAGGLTTTEFSAYQPLWASGELTVRVNAMVRVFPGTTKAELDRALDAIRNLGFATGFGDEWLRLGAIKVTADGGVETNYLREPFAHTDDPTAPRGKPHVSVENLTALGLLADQLGWQLGVHCVGDAGTDLVLDAFAGVHAKSPLTGKRWTLIHLMLAHPEHFARAKAMDLVITAQQPLAYSLAGGWIRYWGRERAARVEPLRAYLDSGLPVGGGSDAPVTPYQPLLGIWSSATRATQLEGVLGPEWAIPLGDAFRWYTRGSAYCAFEEHLKGTLEPGKLADLIALSVDPTQASPTEVRDAAVLLTMVGGKIVHDGRPSRSGLPVEGVPGFAAAELGCHCAEPTA